MKKLILCLFVFIIPFAIFGVYRLTNDYSNEIAKNYNLDDLTDGEFIFGSFSSADKNHSFKLEVAKSNEARAKGLMNRTQLEDGEGMIFIFEDEKIRNFWMKNTLIPLDIIFLDSDFRVLNIENALKVNSLEPIYKSEGGSMYVIELNAGEAASANIMPGYIFSIDELIQN